MPSETATLAGGCFWCLEAVFQQVKGVSQVVSGYSGGHVVNPTYEQVCAKNTGHAEVVQISFNPEVVSFRQLLEVFFTLHDPTSLNRQGNDVGPQYRSAIFFHSPQQKMTAEEVVLAFENERVWPDPIVTEVSPFEAFYPAETYHQNYFKRNPYQPYCMFVVAPKVAKFRKHFLDKLKS